MNAAGRKTFRILITGILFLLLLSGGAQAEKTLTASCPSRSGEKVTARYGKDGYVLSLPGFWDLGKIRLEMEGSGTLLLGADKRTVRADEDADLTALAGKRITVSGERQRTPEKLMILQGSRIPALFLEVDEKRLQLVQYSKERQITEGRAVYTEADGNVAYDGPIDQLKGRGNNTFRYRKKPYQLKLREKTSLSGMGKGKTWVLLANWTDVSQLRNRIMQDMSREIGLRNALRCVHADLWINGQYQGLYLITEKIQIGKERLPITNLEKATEKVNASPLNPGKLETVKSARYPLMRFYPAIRDPEDITGGYIFTIEKYHRLQNNKLEGFRTKEGLSVHIKEPTRPSQAQAEYLYGAVSRMQRALAAENGIEPETGKAYDEYLDVTSFAQMFLLEDWCKNYDFTGGSIFLYKDSDTVDPKIYAGPAWDFDLSFGNMADKGRPPQGNWVVSVRNSSNIWWSLDRHASFRGAVADIWRTVFRPAAAVLLGETEPKPGSALRSLDAYREEIEASVDMNYHRWPVSKDTTVREARGSFDGAVKYLRKWIGERTAAMDQRYAETND